MRGRRAGAARWELGFFGPSRASIEGLRHFDVQVKAVRRDLPVNCPQDGFLPGGGQRAVGASDLAAVGGTQRIVLQGEESATFRGLGTADRCSLSGGVLGAPGIVWELGGRFRGHRCAGGWPARGNRPCGRAAGTKCRPWIWRRRLCYPARRRSSKWQRRENVAQREMRDKGGSAAPAGTPPGRLRPGRDSSPGSRGLLLLFFLALYNFPTLIGSFSAGFPQFDSPA